MEGRREFIKIRRLLEKHSPEELEKAVQRALAINATTVDVIRILLQENREQPANPAPARRIFAQRLASPLAVSERRSGSIA